MMARSPQLLLYIDLQAIEHELLCLVKYLKVVRNEYSDDALGFPIKCLAGTVDKLEAILDQKKLLWDTAIVEWRKEYE